MTPPPRSVHRPSPPIRGPLIPAMYNLQSHQDILPKVHLSASLQPRAALKFPNKATGAQP